MWILICKMSCIWKGRWKIRQGFIDMQLIKGVFWYVWWLASRRDIARCKYLSDIWKSFNPQLIWGPQQWVLSQYVQSGPNDELKILFQFLRYWGLQHNLNICNAFMLMVQIEWKTIWRHSYVEFLDVSACRDHFLKCIFRFANGFTWCLFPYICK